MNNTESDVNIVVKVINAGIWTITTLLVLLLNAVCLIILPKVKGINESTKVFLTSMTIGDFNLGVFYYLPMIGVAITGGTWPFGAFCYVQALVIRQGLLMNMMSAVLITFDRYTAVVHPLRYVSWVTEWRAKIITFSIAALTTLYAFSFLLLELNRTLFNPILQICLIGENNLTTYLLTFTSGILMFVVFIAMYIKILKVASKHAVRIAAQQNPIAEKPLTPSRRSFTTIFIITSLLIIGYIPFSIISIMVSANIQPPWIIVNMTKVLLASVSWLNVMIYYVRNKEFRKTTQSFLQNIRQYCSCHE